jgi:hypothetical protein
MAEDTSARFCDCFQGERLYLPTDRHVKTEIVRQRVAEMRARGAQAAGEARIACSAGASRDGLTIRDPMRRLGDSGKSSEAILGVNLGVSSEIAEKVTPVNQALGKTVG